VGQPARAVAEHHRDAAAQKIGDRGVELPVEIEVADRDRKRVVAVGGKRGARCGAEPSAPVSEEDRDVVGARVDDGV
jgi:hypothetical protein